MATASRRILVVEDEAIISLGLAEILQTLGHSTTWAGRVSDAVALLDSQTFDAATLDLNLAGELSLGLAQILIRRDIPFIIVTGYERPDFELNAAPVVSKPFADADIALAINEVLERPSQHRLK